MLKQKDIPVKPIPTAVSPQYLLSVAKEKLDPDDLALFCVIYTTGARIKEVLALERKDIIIKEMYGKKIMEFHCKNQKNRRLMIKIIPLIREGIDVEFYDIIYEYIKDIQQEAKLFYLSDWEESARVIAHRRLNKIRIKTTATWGQEFINPYYFKLYPHFLRHCRTTHWREHWGLGDREIMRLAGWSSPAMIGTYDVIATDSIIKRRLGVRR